MSKSSGACEEIEGTSHKPKLKPLLLEHAVGPEYILCPV